MPIMTHHLGEHDVGWGSGLPATEKDERSSKSGSVQNSGRSFIRQKQVLRGVGQGVQRTWGVEQRGRMDEEVVGRIAPRGGPTRMRSQAPSSARSGHVKAPAEGAKFRGSVYTIRASCGQVCAEAGVKEGFERLFLERR